VIFLGWLSHEFTVSVKLLSSYIVDIVAVLNNDDKNRLAFRNPPVRHLYRYDRYCADCNGQMCTPAKPHW
jgi:hypothetical protein